MKLISNIEYGKKPESKMENDSSVFRYPHDSPTLFEHYTVLLQYYLKNTDLLLYSYLFLLIFIFLVGSHIEAAKHDYPVYSCDVVLSFGVAHSCEA